MVLSASFLLHLSRFASSLDEEPDLLAEPLEALTGDLTSAVASFCGLRLTVTQDGYPVTLTHFNDDAVPRTSVRLPLSLLAPSFAAGSEIVVYAGSPGALVDFAADAAVSLRTGQTTGPGIELDADLPPLGQESGLVGAVELSTINRAVGLMMDRGHHPDEVHQTLRRQAAGAGVEPLAWARRVLLD